MRWNTLLNPFSLVLALSALFFVGCGGDDCDEPNPDFDPSVPGSEACLGPVVADLPSDAGETATSTDGERFQWKKAVRLAKTMKNGPKKTGCPEKIQKKAENRNIRATAETAVARMGKERFVSGGLWARFLDGNRGRRIPHLRSESGRQRSVLGIGRRGPKQSSRGLLYDNCGKLFPHLRSENGRQRSVLGKRRQWPKQPS